MQLHAADLHPVLLQHHDDPGSGLQPGGRLDHADGLRLFRSEQRRGFVVLPCHSPELDGFDQHFQATVHFPLTSPVD